MADALSHNKNVNRSSLYDSGWTGQSLTGIPMELWMYRARKIVIKDECTGLYHYTRLAHPPGLVEAVGYCAKGCPGHYTWEDAREHYRQYLLDHGLVLRYDAPEHPPQIPREEHKCAICGQPGFHACILEHDQFDSPSGWSWCLCERHQTRETVARLFRLHDFHILNWSHHMRMDDLHEYVSLGGEPDEYFG